MGKEQGYSKSVLDVMRKAWRGALWVREVGGVQDRLDWRRLEARTRVCFVLWLCLWLSGGVLRLKKVGWGLSESDRAASYTARLRSGQEAGVGAGPESHGRGGVDGFVGVAVV